jgi:hypothetical protein
MKCEGSPSEKGVPSGSCKLMREQCEDSFCVDLCLHDAVWKCEASVTYAGDGKSLLDGPLSPQEARALCAQTKALVCGQASDCCKTTEPKEPDLKTGTPKKDDKGLIDPLREWVQAQASMDVPSVAGEADGYVGVLEGGIVGSQTYPSSPLPLSRCSHDPRDKTLSDLICTQCKSQLKVDLVVPEEVARCSVFEPLGGGLMSLQPDEGNAGKRRHGFLYTRCQKMTPELMGVLAGSDIQKWQSEGLCKCAGCCVDPAEDNSKGGPSKAKVAPCPIPDYGYY